MAKKKATAKTIRRFFEAVEGFACQCAVCTSPDAGELMPPGCFCARCGHSYLDLRTGRADDARMGCSKCGAVGQFEESRPVLQPPPVRSYYVRLRRTVIQTSSLTCRGNTLAAVVDRALKYAADGLAWTDEETFGSPHVFDVSEPLESLKTPDGSTREKEASRV